ncbi:MAG TPA: ROK family transcriptional regulator [Acidobacteriota bacterium]|nr:ROK family transcriptional regulator [Acidobacteriota bacterium]
MKKMDIGNLAPANHRVLRDINEVMVLNVIREKQPISRIEIAELTGLEGSTISKIVARLVADAMVYEEGLAEASPQGGRKKRYLHINPNKACAIAVDFRPSGYTVALSDFRGKIRCAVDLPSNPDPHRAITEIAESIRGIMTSCKGESVEGIGVSLIGLVDPKEGRVLAGEGLGWGEDVPVGSMIREAVDLDIPIYFENGAWLGALAEIWFGKHARPPRNLVFLDIGEGIGSGIIIQGQFYHGSMNGAGEFGHIPLHPEGPSCSCGSRGCLEAYAADPATVSRYEGLCRSRREPGSPRVSGVTIDEVIARALQGELEAAEALQEKATYLGRGLRPIVYSLNPEIIVVGGPIIHAWEFVYPFMIRELSQRVPRYYMDHLKLIPTTLENRPSLVGAIALVLARSFAVPSVASIV